MMQKNNGAALRAVRVACFPRRQDAADWLGISERTLRRMESGAAPVRRAVWLALYYRAAVESGDLGLLFGWQDWRIQGGRLHHPAFRRQGVTEGDIRALPYLYALIAELKRQARQDRPAATSTPADVVALPRPS